MTDARAYQQATRLADGTVLVAGGGDNGGNAFASAELYDPGSESWTAAQGMGAARVSFTATLLLDGRVLVAGGSGSSSDTLASAELYDPVSGSWTVTGSMIGVRSGHTATLLPDGNVLVAGGLNGNFDSSAYTRASAQLYDPGSGSWIATGTMIEARAGHAATLLADGRVLVAGGANGTSGTLASAEVYDPVTGP